MLHAFGWRGLARRAVHVAGVRSGWLARRTTARGDFSSFDPSTWPFRFDLDRVRDEYAQLTDLDQLREAVVARAERVLAGELELYGWAWKDVGWPPRWHTNPFTGHTYPPVHWSHISDDDPRIGDIKDVWELSRLPFTCLFARAYILTGEDRWPEAWWDAIEDWADHNPPNVGVNWRCGQETSLRAIALQFGLATFGDLPNATPQRLDLARRLLAASQARVRPTVRYALSQRNNHAISELVFLLSMRPDDERQLLRYLIEVLDDQFYEDGSYAQQSFTYHRLAIHTLAWLLTVRPDLPPGAHTRVVQALTDSREFLARCTDPVSGWAPNYGANDGALLFPLDEAAYRDFRPTLALLGHVDAEPDRWEAPIWLALPPVRRTDSDVADATSTYVTMRGPRSLLMMRVGTGRHRAAHLDQLAIELFVDGRNIVRDPGTFRYTAPAPWRNALVGPEIHSGPHLPGEATHLSRFLVAQPTPGELLHHGMHGDTETVVASRPLGGGEVVRVVARERDVYAVVDTARDVDAVVRWNTGKEARLSGTRPPGATLPTLAPTDDDPGSGWVSDHYAQREPTEVVRYPARPGPVLATLGVDGRSDVVASIVRAVRPWLTEDERAVLAGLLRGKGQPAELHEPTT